MGGAEGVEGRGSGGEGGGRLTLEGVGRAMVLRWG